MTWFRSLALAWNVASLRQPILDLALAFESAGGWGRERAFNKWALKQTWRKAMPHQYFQRLIRIKILFSRHEREV